LWATQKGDTVMKKDKWHISSTRGTSIEESWVDTGTCRGAKLVHLAELTLQTVDFDLSYEEVRYKPGSTHS
jgi:hypothetical protein